MTISTKHRFKFVAIAVTLAGFPYALDVTAQEVDDLGKNAKKPLTFNDIVSAVAQPPELSGCAAVKGGALIVDDEVVGAVKFSGELSARPLPLTPVNLERKKKQRKPYAEQDKLFPLQDFEDIASDRDELVYLLGSHNGKKGERRPDREFLLRAEWDLEEEELKVVEENYNLLDQIGPLLTDAGTDIGLSKEGVVETLNLEGLALVDDQLFIGFRGPLTSEKEAFLITGAAADMMDGKRAGELTTMRLNLNGAGIRGMDWDPKRKRLLIISGTVEDDGAVKPALWQCKLDGSALEKILEFDEALGRRNPEGICRLESGKLLVVLDGEDRASGSDAVFLED